MKTHALVQGSDQWAAFRLAHFGASEVAAMLGLSTKARRSELLHIKHTGTPREFSDWVQEHILDPGHEMEAKARPLVEADIGEDLYPVTCSRGRLSASCDGLTMDESTAFEHKRWNESYGPAMLASGAVPEEHMPQCQQVLMITGAERLIFVMSDGTRDNWAEVVVLPDPAWFERIEAGWAQFEKDLSGYVPPEPQPAAPVGHAPETLPALRIEITGSVTASNLAEFKVTALKRIRSINRDLTTDQHFADAAEAVKWCETVESRIEAAKEHALSQTESIDALLKTLDEIKAEARQMRLDLDKLVEKRKAEIKESILMKARHAYAKHVCDLEAEIEPLKLWLAAPDFTAAAKNRRTVATLQDALDTALANGKIAANAAAQEVRTKLGWYREETTDHAFLFADLQALIQKPTDDFKLAVTARIDAHKAAEAKKKADADAAAQLAAQTIATAAAPKPAPLLMVTAHDGGVSTARPAQTFAVEAVAPWEATEPNLVTMIDDLLEHIDKAFDTKFPSHPKPSPAWWAELLKQSTALREATAD